MFYLFFALFYITLLFYGYSAIRVLAQSKWLVISFWAVALGLFVSGFVLRALNVSLGTQTELYLTGLLFAVTFGLMVLSFFLILEDIVRLIAWTKSKLKSFFGAPQSTRIDRRRFISATAVTVGALPFSSLIIGMGARNKYTLHTYDLVFDRLPKSFDGYTIVQISDLHLGSFASLQEFQPGLDSINDQAADLLLFTGDMVNNQSAEALPYIEALAGLSATDGKFAVLGNHDYGSYNRDFDEEMAREDVRNLLSIQQQMGFKTLNNESLRIYRGEDYFNLVGVENWGTGRFLKAGDLKQATADIDESVFTLLMSHDPSHWEAEVLGHDKKIDLCLSGHTHGFQFGVEIAGYKWSPIQYRYPQWAGMYEKNNLLLNVNRGFGFLGYPGRFGIWPEITRIRLKSSEYGTVE
ncbi:MAG: metallophosphoesterase [Bacteroidetes bacterium]|nr:metallophosphoesterase [Bacteroidota bacterium]MDA0950286.1 metallophosphoesterase [Bacteroidota bacterium]